MVKYFLYLISSLFLFTCTEKGGIEGDKYGDGIIPEYEIPFVEIPDAIFSDESNNIPRDIVDNYEGEFFEEIIKELPPPPVFSENKIKKIDFLIITSKKLAKYFEPLLQWRMEKGIGGKIEVMEWIKENYFGRDEAEALRSYIKDMYKKEKIRSVLLGGDSEIVPVRTIFVAADVLGYFYTENPDGIVELYYSDLDGTWDENKNGIFGEFDDGLEMHPEIQSARVPVSTAEDVQNYVQKVLSYEKNPPEGYLEKMLMIGEFTGWFDIYASLILEPWSVSFIPSNLKITKLYDDYKNFKDAQPNTENIQISEINKGYGMVLHLGHGTQQVLGYIQKENVYKLKNSPKNTLYISSACNGGTINTEEDDAVGEIWLTNKNGGGIGYIGSTDIAIGFPPMLMFMEDFLDGLFYQGMETLGSAYNYALTHFMENPETIYMDLHFDRFTMLTNILLGDPEIPIWIKEPEKFKVTFPEKISKGVNEIKIFVEDGGGNPVTNALISLYSKSSLLLTGYSYYDGSSKFVFEGKEGMKITLTITKNGFIPFQKSFIVGY